MAMKLMKSFTKKGYYCGGKYLVFKSYGNKVKGVLQAPALEDTDGYIEHSIYTVTLNEQEQLTQVINSYVMVSGMMSKQFRVFDEHGEPYEDV